jgi:2-keto-4-pentenoate hydratase
MRVTVPHAAALSRRLSVPAVALAIVGCATPGGAPPPDCPSDAQVAAMARRFVALQPEPDPPASLSLAGAECGRDRLVQALRATQGPVIGYKTALTNPAVQQRFGWSSPIRGALFERSIVPDGSTVRADYGQRPVFEADLVVEVGSSAIHDATTPAQVLASLRAVHPFIELADLVAENPGRLGGPGITLITPAPATACSAHRSRWAAIRSSPTRCAR